MGFQEAVQRAFAKYADFNGRARRSEYWYFVLFTFLVSMAISILATPLGGPRLVYVLNFLFMLAVFIPSLSLAFRRLHDSGRTGLWFLLTFVPLGAVVLFVFFCLDSQPGENEYGPNPKETDIVFWQ
ncbi:MAG: DUF805 domain-containing protein [Oscillibacter sp.]|nr:DUF805 domain-containing protein [Oscillibacter sp.]